MTAVAKPLTVDDYLDFPSNGLQIQLIEGELIMAPAPSSRHQLVVANVSYLLIGHTKTLRQGRVLTAPIDVFLSEFSVVQPDVAYVTNLEQLSKRGIEGPPRIVVEVLSPSTASKDRGAKRTLYINCGVEELWIVDPDAQLIEVVRGDKHQTIVHNGIFQSICGLEVKAEDVFS